jgi:hypothetical protein
MIVWLASYPRSGNTFFRILLHRLHGFATHSVYSTAQTGVESPEDTRLLSKLVGQFEIECDLEALKADPALHFVKTHDLPGDDDSPAIVLVRDGRDAVLSFAHFLLKAVYGIDNPGKIELENTLEDVILGDTFGGWSRNVNAWADRVGNDMVFRYEDLIRDPVGVVGEGLHRFSLNGGPVKQAAPSFSELHEKVPWFFRKGKPGGWKDEMPPRLEKLFLDRHGEAFARFGYSISS